MLAIVQQCRLMSASRKFSRYKILLLNQRSAHLYQCTAYIPTPLNAYCYSVRFSIEV